MASNIGWELYRSFLAVIDAGSLSGAARELAIAQPTVGRHVTALERALGAPLFTRSQMGLTPTETALSLREYARSMAVTAAALERAASSQGADVGGVVRITASDIIGIEVLPPILTALREEHPDLKVELVLTDRMQDLLRQEADIAVRMARPRQKLLIGRRVGRIELGLHAHQRYLSRHGTPRTPAELAGHALIGFDQATEFIRSASKRVGGWQRDAFAMRTDNNLAQLALIRAAAGIGICQVHLARRDAGIVRLLPRQYALHMDTWITMHEDLRYSPRCRATFDALVDGLEGYIRP